MRILIINLLYPPAKFGGAEKAASLLAEAFAKHGDEVFVISLHPGCDEKVEQRNGVQIYSLPLDNIYWPLDSAKKQGRAATFFWHVIDIWNNKAAKRVGRILDEVKPDVVHTHVITGLSVSIWKEIKKRRIRLVHTLHDYYLICARSSLFRNGDNCERPCIECRALTAVPKLLSRKVDTVVSVSNHVIKTHRKYGRFKGVSGKVIYNIENSITGNHSNYRDTIKESASGGRLIFGYIGRISPEKGVEALLHATTYIKNPAWQLKIAGGGNDDYVAELRRKFSDPRIEWLGFMLSREFYSSVNVIVIPSVWQDPLPYVAIESFAAGKSVICAESGGLPELASLGKMVETYPAMDARALSETMEKAILNQSAWRDGGFANSEAKAAFSEDAVVNQYRAVYSQANRP